MKILVPFLFIVLFGKVSFGQNYHLLPDTCTYCSYFANPGGPANYLETYYLNPENDTMFLGNNYMKIPITSEAYQGAPIFGVRQVGNTVLGVVEGGSTQEYLVQDWTLQIGDTAFNLYSNRTFYDAIFMGEDSVLLNDNTYHHTREMQGIRYAPNGISDTISWTFYWEERGLCAEHVAPNFANSGGLMYNLPGYNYGAISTVYYLPKPHTADWRYNMDSYMDNCTFTGGTNSLFEKENKTFQVYPNPTSGLLNISSIGKAFDQLEILNLNGQVLLMRDAQTKSIDLTAFDTGIYLLRLYLTDGSIAQAKIMKSK